MRYIFLITVLLLASCTKNEFTLEFDLKEDITENYNVTYYATDIHGGGTVQAVASVRDGKCELKGLTKKPTLVYVSTRRSKLPLVVYAERGEKIIFKGDERDPLSWDTEGNDINASLSLWREQNMKILEEALPDSVNMAVEKFVVDNSSDPVSSILMLNYYNRLADEKGFSELMASMHGQAKNENWLRISGRADQTMHYYTFPARLESLIMRSGNKYGDTLEIDGKNPVILFFWQNGDTDRKSIVDSMKKLEKDFPDSVRIMADICVDVDSAGWRSTIRRDSLNENAKRLWAPRGLTDATVMKLKVKALPYYIVFDKEGYQTYSGTDLDKALSDYRDLMRESKEK